jgi:hypothetical protein
MSSWPRAQNVPKTKVERVKLVEIIEAGKKDLRGVILYMFTMGLELHAGQIKHRAHATVATSHASILRRI